MIFHHIALHNPTYTVKISHNTAYHRQFIVFLSRIEPIQGRIRRDCSVESRRSEIVGKSRENGGLTAHLARGRMGSRKEASLRKKRSLEASARDRTKNPSSKGLMK
jgi:hypothetical protein